MAGQSLISFCQLFDINKLLSRGAPLLCLKCSRYPVLFFLPLHFFRANRISRLVRNYAMHVLAHEVSAIRVQIRFVCLFDLSRLSLQAWCVNDLAPRPLRAFSLLPLLLTLARTFIRKTSKYFIKPIKYFFFMCKCFIEWTWLHVNVSQYHRYLESGKDGERG